MIEALKGAAAIGALARAQEQLEEYRRAQEIDDELGRMEDRPLGGEDYFESQLERLEEEFEERQELLREAHENELIAEEEFLERRNALHEQYAQERQRIETQRNALILASASSTFGALADSARQFAGEQSGIYKALFADSKAFAIAEAVIKIQVALANAMAAPFPLNLLQYAQVAALGASIITTITSMAMNFAEGGLVRGPGGPRDDKVRANLSAGEFVINAAATAKNLPVLEAINAGAEMPDAAASMLTTAAEASALALPAPVPPVDRAAGGIVEGRAPSALPSAAGRTVIPRVELPRMPESIRVDLAISDSILSMFEMIAATAGAAPAAAAREPASPRERFAALALPDMPAPMSHAPDMPPAIADIMERGVAPPRPMPALNGAADRAGDGKRDRTEVDLRVINESGYPVRAEKDPFDPSRMRIIAQDEVRKGAGDAAASDLADSNSDFSKAVGRFTTAERRR